jgi:glycine betaine transporter
LRMQRVKQMFSGTGSVFWVTAALSAALIVWGLFFTGNFTAVVSTIFGQMIANLSWFYMVVTTLFLGFCIWLALSRYGKIRLGKDDERPEFGWFSWVAMLFQAGMGLAVVFWGGAEPVTHYADPPFGEAQAYTTEAAQLAMQYSFFHWGLHAWGVFAVTGLAVAYFSYRKDAKGVISPIFYPILGERVNGPIGKAIDILAVFVTLVGIAVSLGLGGLQIGAGFEQALGFSNVLSLQLIIIAVTAVAYMLSAATPLEKGVKWLSNISMIVGAFLAIYFLVAGPTILIINAFVQGIGDYLGALIPMSLTTGAFGQDTEFLSKFTTFYWGWWVAWAAFVGIFAARISRGRTIREFVVGILVVPSLICMVWFAIAGASGIELDQTLGGTLSAAATSDPAAGFFVFLQYYPLPIITSLVTIFLLWIFFVAGADAGTIVMGSMSAGGDLDPTRFVRLVWGAVIGLVAAVLLLSGGIESVQQAAVVVGLPFAIVMLFICYALYKALRADYHEQEEGRQEEQEPEDQAVREPVGRPAPNPNR